MSKILKIIFILMGIGLFAWALYIVDMVKVGNLLLQMGFGFIIVLAIYGVVTWVDTIAWQYGFKPEETKSFKLWQLWRIRQIGEAFNTITPFGTVGGEPVKAQLLKEKHGLSFKQGLASQVVGRTTFLMALIFFLVPGTVLVFMSDFVSDSFKQISLWGLIIFSTMIILFFLFQVTGGLGKLTVWGARLFPKLESTNILKQLTVLDSFMSEYYRNHPMRFVKSVGYAFIGWLVGLGEMYVTLYFLGHEVSFFDLWIIEALSQLVRVGSFFIPLSIGAQEGGLILIFSSMGMTADMGLAVSFVRRIKELVWVGMGLVMAWAMAFKPARSSGDLTSET
ncbi:MAG: flippase-like domain-containing protein [Nitrospinales bacterium]